MKKTISMVWEKGNDSEYAQYQNSFPQHRWYGYGCQNKGFFYMQPCYNINEINRFGRFNFVQWIQ